MAVFLLALVLSGCAKASEEKLAEVSDAFSALTEARAKAEETYDKLYDDTLFVRLTEAGKQLDVVLSENAAALTDEEIDTEILAKTAELTGTYAELQEMMDTLYAAQEERRTERENRKQILFCVLNKSGATLTNLRWVLGDASAAKECLSLEGDLASGETLAGLTVPVIREPEETLWLYADLPGKGGPQEKNSDGKAKNGDEKKEESKKENTKEETPKEETAEEDTDDGVLRFRIGETGEYNESQVYDLKLLPEEKTEVTGR